MKPFKSVEISLAAAALTLPLIASAASTVATGTGTLTATATVNFTVVIPQYLYLRVGTGSTYTTGALTTVATQDLITFAPAVGTVGNGTAVAGTGGDLTGGVETAAVLGDRGRREHHGLHHVGGPGAQQHQQLGDHYGDEQGGQSGRQMDLQLRELHGGTGRHVRRHHSAQRCRDVHGVDAVGN
jgi:hypothetical protein